MRAGRRGEVGPGEVVPRVQRRGSVLVEAEARRGRLLLDDEEPAGVVRLAARRRLGQVEAEERDVGIDPPAEERKLLLGPDRLQGLRPDGVDQRVGIAVQELAAHEQHDARRLAAEALAQRRAAGSQVWIAGSCPIGLGRPRRVPEAPEVGAAHVARELAPQELPGELVVQPDHVRLDEAGVVVQERDRVGHDRPDAGKQELGREVAQRLVHRLRERRREQHAVAGQRPAAGPTPPPRRRARRSAPAPSAADRASRPASS